MSKLQEAEAAIQRARKVWQALDTERRDVHVDQAVAGVRYELSTAANALDELIGDRDDTFILEWNEETTEWVATCIGYPRLASSASSRSRAVLMLEDLIEGAAPAPGAG